MQDFTDRRDDASRDEIWVLQHPSVFTLGQAGKPEHLLNPGTIPVIKTDRGGQVTYHGPGQLVVYLLLDLRRKKLGVRQLVDCIEQAIIALLRRYSIDAKARPDAPGVYIDDAKIAALGLRVRHGCSFHGLAFNVDLDLTPFAGINPCGYAGMAVTRLIDQIETKADIELLGKQLLEELQEQLGYTARIITHKPPLV